MICDGFVFDKEKFVFGSVAFISVIVSGVYYVMCLGFSQSAECFVYSIAAGTNNGKIVPKIILKMTDVGLLTDPRMNTDTRGLGV